MTWKKGLLTAGVILLVVAVGLVVWLRVDYPRAPATMYFGGTVLTMDPAQPTAEAVLVQDGTIVAVGSTEQVREQGGAEAQSVDLEGRTMMPGFIDAHSHVDLSVFLHSMVDLSGFTHPKAKQVWATLREAVAAAAPGEWIPARGLDPILTSDLRTPSIAKLDRIAPDNPVLILSQTLHNYWANSAAFAAAGITDETPDPSTSSYYGRTKDGRLGGLVVEQAAFQPLKDALMAATPKEELLGNVAATLRQYAANGNTTVVTAGLSSDDKSLVLLLEHLSAENAPLAGQALSRAGIFPDREPMPRQYLYLRPEMTDLLPDSPDNGDDAFKILGVKLWYDGSPYSGSAYLHRPYMQSKITIEDMHLAPGHTGEPLISEEDFAAAVEKYNSEGWQVIVHAQGDEALDQVAAGFEQAGATMDLRPYRDRIEHGMMQSRPLVERMWKLGVSTSFHINHIYYYGEALRDEIIGRKRAEAMLPVGTSLDIGAPFSLHADQPMFESKPFHLMYTAITRKTEQGSRLGADEAIPVQEALESMTTGAAWQIHMEDHLGSITPGKYADLVVLDSNPLETPMSRFRDIQVLKTIVNGNEVALQ